MKLIKEKKLSEDEKDWILCLWRQGNKYGLSAGNWMSGVKYDRETAERIFENMDADQVNEAYAEAYARANGQEY